MQLLQKSNCIVCQNEFEIKSKNHPKQKYCSNKCIKTAWREKNPEAYKKAQQKWIENNPEKRKKASDNYRYC